MLILQIALGIVLAVVILRFLPELISLALLLGVLALILGAIGLAIAALWQYPDALILIGILAGIAFLFGAGHLIIRRLHFLPLSALLEVALATRRWQHLPLDEVAGMLFFVVLWALGFGSWILGSMAQRDYANSFLGVGIAVISGTLFGLYAASWNRRRFAEWQKKKLVAESYAKPTEADAPRGHA